MKRDRTQEWVALGQRAADELPGSHADPLVHAWCVLPVVQLIRMSQPRVFGISGPPGAGKSTVAREVTGALATLGLRAVALSLDDFYLPRKERERRGIPWRAAPGSHDVDLMARTLAMIQSKSQPIVLPRFDQSRDDRSPDQRLDDVPDVVVFDGWIIGHDEGGYGEMLQYLDWHLHIDVPRDVARERRFGRETRLREETGRAFAPAEMQQFWDEVLGPGIDTWVREGAERADVVVRLTETSASCLAEPRLDEFLPERSGRRS